MFAELLFTPWLPDYTDLCSGDFSVYMPHIYLLTELQSTKIHFLLLVNFFFNLTNRETEPEWDTESKNIISLF